MTSFFCLFWSTKKNDWEWVIFTWHPQYFFQSWSSQSTDFYFFATSYFSSSARAMRARRELLSNTVVQIFAATFFVFVLISRLPDVFVITKNVGCQIVNGNCTTSINLFQVSSEVGSVEKPRNEKRRKRLSARTPAPRFSFIFSCTILFAPPKLTDHQEESSNQFASCTVNQT